jgi:hypothetical protein
MINSVLLENKKEEEEEEERVEGLIVQRNQLTLL